MVPEAGAVTVMEIVADAPLPSDAAVQVTFAAPAVQVNVALLTLTNEPDEGSAPVTVTFEASPGPLFVTTRSNETVLPGVTTVGVAVMVSARSALVVLITTDLFAVALHAPAVAVTLSVTLPMGPAVNWMAFVPWPPETVPFEIDQAYVAPAMLVTEAELFVEFAPTNGCAVMAIDVAVTFTLVLAVAVQLPFATETEMGTLPEEGAVKVMVFVP